MYFDSNNDDDVNEVEYHVPAIRNNNVNDEAGENYNYITDTDQYGNEARARRPYSLAAPTKFTIATTYSPILRAVTEKEKNGKNERRERKFSLEGR